MRVRRIVAALAAATAVTLGGTQSAQAAAAPRVQADDTFTAIVALDNCSASLVRFADSQGSDQAAMLTNGHCYEGGFLDPGVVLTNQPSSRTGTLLDASGSALGTLHADEVEYATMTGTDATLYRLQETYDDISSRYGTTALTIADAGPAEGDAITVKSGYWKTTYHCSVAEHVHELHEGDWVWHDSLRYSQPGCETIHGTSGSPVLSDTTGEVVAINNTGNDDGERCTENNPCEVDEDGTVTYQQGWSYAEQTSWFTTCLDADRQVDLAVPGCQLTQPTP